MTIDKMIARLIKLREKYGGDVDVRQLQPCFCINDRDEFEFVVERVVEIKRIKYRKNKNYAYIDMI